MTEHKWLDFAFLYVPAQEEYVIGETQVDIMKTIRL